MVAQQKIEGKLTKLFSLVDGKVAHWPRIAVASQNGLP
jgi:hypothetical protein